MVNVGMRQHHRVQILDREGKSAVFFCAVLSFALKHPAVERDGVTIYMEEVTGPCHLTCGADECYFQTANLRLPHHAERGSSGVVHPVTSARAPTPLCSFR